MQLYIGRNNKREGPYTEVQVREMVSNGTIKHTAWAWHTGLSEWKPLNKIIPIDEGHFWKNRIKYVAGAAFLVLFLIVHLHFSEDSVIAGGQHPALLELGLTVIGELFITGLLFLLLFFIGLLLLMVMGLLWTNLSIVRRSLRPENKKQTIVIIPFAALIGFGVTFGFFDFEFAEQAGELSGSVLAYSVETASGHTEKSFAFFIMWIIVSSIFFLIFLQVARKR